MPHSSNPLSPIACACVALLDEHGRVLLVHRKQGNGVCMPGGKVDPGEDIRRAAARELLEETGARVDVEHLVAILTGSCPSDGPMDHMTTTFLAARWQGTIGTGEALMRPYWGHWDDLIERSPFSAYNLAMLEQGLLPHLAGDHPCPRRIRWRQAVESALSE